MKFPFCCSSCSISASEITVDTTSRQGEQNDQNFRVFTYNELKTATHGFSASNKIGAGASGSVYKGRLRDGTIVAVKVLSIELESMRGEREFVSELSALSNIKHENLVTLHGCCIDGANRYLVYDYMENNSLAHRLLEQGEHYLVQKAWQLYNDNDLVRLVDPELDVNYPEVEAVQLLKVGLLCVQENVKLRPIMSTAVKMLTGEIDIRDDQISQPGFVADLMDIKLAQQMLSQSISSSSGTTSQSTTSFY
ncbi:hypothetical protein Q3G72_031841 [Acer saccharum]|nr:hypothetical protein Q3G72_031841 [Acer saccharum]